MKSKILSFLLVCVFCMGSIASTALAAEEADGTAPVQSEPTEVTTPAAEPTEEPPQQPSAAPEPIVPLPIDNVPEPTISASEAPTATPEPTATPTATPTPSNTLTVRITGNGTLEASVNGAWERVPAGEFEMPAEPTEFRATASGNDSLVSVLLNDQHVRYTQDASEKNVWRFTLTDPTAQSTLALTFSNEIRMDLSVDGPGNVSQQVNNTWQELTPGAGAATMPAAGNVRLTAAAAQDGYACTSIKVNGVETAPLMFSAEGAVFEAVAKDGACEVAVEFTRSDQLVMDIEGQGKVYLVKGSGWIELADEARLPFQTERDAPMQFMFVPATGYNMGAVTFQGGALSVTQENATQNNYTTTLISPVNGGVLKATFLAGDDSLIEWIRGTDTPTGISWAVPLGSSMYGVSNVTPSSRILITRLTQGAAYDAARTAATPYSQFAVWDISLVDANGQAYTPTVPVLMNLPIPSGYPTTIPPLRMLHILSNGRVVENTIETRQNPQTGSTYLYMRADSLSTFVLVNTNSAATNTATPAPGTTAQAGGTANTTPTAPRTGDSSNLPLWWTMLVLSIAAIAVSGFELGRASAGK